MDFGYNVYTNTVIGSTTNDRKRVGRSIEWENLKQGEFLGNGAFGKVYDGEYDGRLVAIKWLDIEHARSKLGGSVSDEEVIESFDWEATNLSLVNHPNIISLIGVVDSGDGRRGLVLELCDGMDLEKLLLENKSENRSMSLRQQFSIMFQLLNGLKYLHENGIIHKDVKVENVLWFRDGRVKWADLGVSAVDSLVQATEAALSQAGVKDMRWNSPEEARIRLCFDNGSGSALAASDVFSFGLIMYAVMSGEGNIWEGSGLHGDLRAIQECLASDRVSQVLKLDESWWCYDLMRQCFALNPQDRSSAQELFAMLKKWGEENGLSRIVLSHELVADIHSSEEARQTYVENLCSTSKGDVESFGGKDEAEFANVDRIFSLSHCVSSFIESDNNVENDRALLLLGDGGTGKSTGMHAMARKMSANCVDSGVQFVFIRPRVQEWSMESLRGACCGIGGGSIVFVLDGYDELRGRNVDVGGESLPEYLGMSSTNRLIVTCRRNIVPDNRVSSVFGGGVRVRYLLPFTKNQISEYLETCGAPQPSSPISNPFVLKLYSTSWQYLPSDQHLKSPRLVLKDIYDASVRAWFIEACGLDDELKNELSVKNFEDFACHVAISMFIDGNRVATSFPSAPPPLQQHQTEDQRQISSSPWFVLEDRVVECAAQLFDSRTSGRSVMSRDDFIRNKLQLLTTQFLHKCPLQKKPGTQLFSFIHKSYRDYFCGMAMTRMMNMYIDKVLVTHDAAVQQWCSRFVDIAAARQHCELGSLSVDELEASTFSIRALEFIEHTRHADPSPSLSIGGANCMTVLNTAGVPLSRRNFSGAQLGDTDDDGGEENVIRRRSDQPFMDLGGAVLYGCDFSGANLSGARLQQACMDHVNFTQCNMSGVEFGQRPSFIGHSECVTSLCVSPDGAYLYSGSEDHSIKKWSVSSGELCRTFESHTSFVNSVCASPDGAFLYSASRDKSIKHWCVSSGELLRTMEGHSGSVSSICISPDGTYLFSGSDDHTVKQWSTLNGQEVLTLGRHSSYVRSLCISPNGAHLYSGSEDNTIKQWCVSSGELLRTMENDSYVNALCVSVDGKSLFSRAGGFGIREWCTSSGETLRRMQGHVDGVHGLCVSPDGAFLYSGARDKSVVQWSLVSGQPVNTMEGHQSFVCAVTVSLDGSSLFSGSRDHHIRQWSTLGSHLVSVHSCGHSDYITHLCMSHDMKYLYSASYDKTVKQWSVATLELLRTLEGHSQEVYCVCTCEDFVFSGSRDQTIIQWSALNGRPIRKFEGHTWTVLGLCTSVCGTYLFSASGDESVKQWCVSTGELIRTFEGHSSWVNAVCVSTDGLYLCAGADDGVLKQWCIHDGQLVRSMCCSQTDGVTALRMSSDGTSYVYATLDSGKIMRWCLHSRASILDDQSDHHGADDGFVKADANIVLLDRETNMTLWSSPPHTLSAQYANLSDVLHLSDPNDRMLKQHT